MSGLGNVGSAFGRLGPVARIASILGFGVVVFALLMILSPKPEAQDPPRQCRWSSPRRPMCGRGT